MAILSNRIGRNNLFSDGVCIGSGVEIGSGNHFAVGVVVDGDVRIGNGNYFGAYSVIGGATRQRLRPYHSGETPHEPGTVYIGSNNLIFEHVTVHRGMRGATRIGHHISIGAHSHIAHDSTIRDECVAAPSITIGGYVTLGRGANLGLAVHIRQRVVIGAYAMCGMGSVIVKSVPPAATVVGIPASFLRPNLVGLDRSELSEKTKAELVRHLGSGLVPCSGYARELVSLFHEDIRRWARTDQETAIVR